MPRLSPLLHISPQRLQRLLPQRVVHDLVDARALALDEAEFAEQRQIFLQRLVADGPVRITIRQRIAAERHPEVAAQVAWNFRRQYQLPKQDEPRMVQSAKAYLLFRKHS